MSTNFWVIKHLEFAMRADDKKEMAARILAVITRLNISALLEEDDIKKTHLLSLILESKQCQSCAWWTHANELGSFCGNVLVKEKNLEGNCNYHLEKQKED